MWTCPKCGEEVEDGFEVCWSCGTSIDGAEDKGFDPERDGVLADEEYQAMRAAREVNLVTVATFWSAPEAHVVRSRLEAEGIRAYVMDELATGTTWGLLNDAGGIKVQVAEKDLGRALEVLADKESGGDEEDEDEEFEDDET